MSDIFISYARSTEAQARHITVALRAQGYGVWRDDELPAHGAYAEVIEERLKSARAVVVIWSAEAVKSQWVRAEANVAREAGTLVQLRMADSKSIAAIACSCSVASRSGLTVQAGGSATTGDERSYGHAGGVLRSPRPDRRGQHAPPVADASRLRGAPGLVPSSRRPRTAPRRPRRGGGGRVRFPRAEPGSESTGELARQALRPLDGVPGHGGYRPLSFGSLPRSADLARSTVPSSRQHSIDHRTHHGASLGFGSAHIPAQQLPRVDVGRRDA